MISQQFWVDMARITEGTVSVLNYIDGRRHGRRFPELGAITQPGCVAAAGPDQNGLWMDRCDQPPVPGIPGEPTGTVGLRKFPNPEFDPVNRDAANYVQHPGIMQPAYLIGMTCGFCHIGFTPLDPPADPERKRDDRRYPVTEIGTTRLPDIVRNSFLLDLFSDEAVYRRMSRNNTAPDFVLDRGHAFGSELSDEDTWALIEYLNTI